jgi:hypothetical protein
MIFSTQQQHLGLRDISAGVATAQHGPPHAVLAVEGVTFALLGDEQQEALLTRFGRLLNALPCPVQFLVDVRPVDLEPRLERFVQEAPPELGDLAREHAAFLRQLCRQRTLLERRYYLAVPGSERPGRMKREAWDAQVRRELTSRCDQLLLLLADCGLNAHRLGDTELAELYYARWAPDYARRQRIQQSLDEWTALAVGGQEQRKVYTG